MCYKNAWTYMGKDIRDHFQWNCKYDIILNWCCKWEKNQFLLPRRKSEQLTDRNKAGMTVCWLIKVTVKYISWLAIEISPILGWQIRLFSYPWNTTAGGLQWRLLLLILFKDIRIWERFSSVQLLCKLQSY